MTVSNGLHAATCVYMRLHAVTCDCMHARAPQGAVHGLKVAMHAVLRPLMGTRHSSGQIWGRQQFGLNRRLIWDPEHRGNGNNIISTYNLPLLDVTRQCNGLRNHFSSELIRHLPTFSHVQCAKIQGTSRSRQLQTILICLRCQDTFAQVSRNEFDSPKR